MSAESSWWLNNMILIGYEKLRGKAWHYNMSEQGVEPNHYEGPVPVEDVKRRLFNFTVEGVPAYYYFDGKRKQVPNKQIMVASDNGDVLGDHAAGYAGHGYTEWLIDNVVSILDQKIGIGSAGLLRNRAQAWVSVEMPENITTPEGVEFRPQLTAMTSFDGSLITTYGKHFYVAVCDNTLNIARREMADQNYKVKHTKYSALKIADAREALAILFAMGDEFSQEIADLTSWTVSDKQFNKTLDLIFPEKEEGETSKKGVTQRENTRAKIINLYHNDERCAPWKGNAFGVLQAFNTYNQHYTTVRKGAAQYERHMERVLKGKVAEADAQVLTILSDVTKHSNNKVLVTV